MRLKLFAAAVVGAAITLPVCAQAATTITETQTFTSSAAPYSVPFTLDAFNTSLGTLQSVEFVLNYDMTPTVIVQNSTGATKSFSDAFASIPLTVTGPGGTTVSKTVTETVASGSLTKNSSKSYLGAEQSGSVNTTFTTGLTAFEGAAALPLSFTVDAGQGTFGGSAAGNVLFGGSAVAGGSFEIVYTYVAAAVPEPTTWALLLLGVGGIGAAMRRRKNGLAVAAA